MTNNETAEYVALTLGDLKVKAEKYKCELVVSSPLHLLIDLDTIAQHETFTASAAILREAEPKIFGKIESWTSRNGKGTHYLIELKEEKSVYERVALQAVLGSDPKRETLCLKRLHEGKGEIIVLYRPMARV